MLRIGYRANVYGIKTLRCRERVYFEQHSLYARVAHAVCESSGSKDTEIKEPKTPPRKVTHK